MVNSSLDNVNELLRLVYGDKGRLEDIKRRLEHDQTLYNSDIEYLQKLVNQYGGEIQKIMASKTSKPEPTPEATPEATPEPTPEPQPEPQSKPQPKKKSSKKKKIGITIVIILISFLLFFAYGSNEGKEMRLAEEEELRNTIEKQEEAIRNMSTEKLLSLSADWTYTDLLRNMDNYKGKLIFVDGTVTNVQRDFNSINLCINMGSYSCDDFMFVRVNGITNWLEDDKLSGFVEVKMLEETGTSSMFTKGEWVGSGKYVPQVKEIKLTCSNC